MLGVEGSGQDGAKTQEQRWGKYQVWCSETPLSLLSSVVLSIIS